HAPLRGRVVVAAGAAGHVLRLRTEGDEVVGIERENAGLELARRRGDGGESILSFLLAFGLAARNLLVVIRGLAHPSRIEFSGRDREALMPVVLELEEARAVRFGFAFTEGRLRARAGDAAARERAVPRAVRTGEPRR